MSVAFRRESDEEHKEPRFELPIPLGPNRVTARGLRLIEEKAAALEAELNATKDEDTRTRLKRDLRYWRTRAATAEIMPPPPDDEVAFGSRVTLSLNGAHRTIDIVGGDEADPAHDRIAFTAPLSRAIMGAAPGDPCDFNGQEGAIRITSVAAIPSDGQDG